LELRKAPYLILCTVLSKNGEGGGGKKGENTSRK